MDTISLRKFRESVADIGETVEVVKREKSGHLRLLGVWTPVPANTGEFRPTVTYSLSGLSNTASATTTHWHEPKTSDER